MHSREESCACKQRTSQILIENEFHSRIRRQRASSSTSFASFASLVFFLLILLLAPAAPAKAGNAPQTQPLDYLLVGGTVVDGSGSAPRPADVGIRGDRIVFIGDSASAHLRAARTIDAKGLIICPGFIDPHTHADSYLSDPDRKNNLNYVMQGVTTVVTGNDGGGPIAIAATLDKWQKGGIGTNVALLTGFGTIRRAVMGMVAADPTPAQLDKMRGYVRSAMQEGAFGLSTGLFYAPQSFSKTEEVIELAKVASQNGGIYDTHMRDEDSYSIGLLGAIDETLRIGREAHLLVHISHIKALGPAVWGQSIQAIARINAARASGQQVLACQYPYTGSGTALPAALLPPWAHEGTPEEVAARLADLAQREKLLTAIEENIKRRGGADTLLFTSHKLPDLFAKTLAQVAAARKMPPPEAALAILQSASRDKTMNQLGLISFNMDESDIDHFMVQPWDMTCSDGSPGHPRLYGTFPRKLRMYVYEKKLITLPFMVHVSSEEPAEMLGLHDRGLLREGYLADVIAFDPSTVADKATYEHPEVLATGMKYIFINGVLTVAAGKYTGALPGRTLRHKPASEVTK
ncbi:MAG TPA: amidohydrolase family protein [Candidatus Acidoferrales bacterium]|nr:amidohydrolase family protein [Candidatus Acidoferrales bacterium]